ncbi:MAG: type III-B CRISPR module-associated protein Cmr5 [Paraglaciecola sp.]|nr:type III-B CRISPR module-associated protein Cmr5 [Paraglaciecola sp.]
MQLQSQHRAKFAMSCITGVQNWPIEEQKQLRAYLQSLPAMIQINGFGQAIAFYKSHPASKKGGKAYQAIYTWLSKWLNEQKIFSGDLMQAICTNDMAKYQLATAETQALLVWLKKFARAYLLDDSEGV